MKQILYTITETLKSGREYTIDEFPDLKDALEAFNAITEEDLRDSSKRITLTEDTIDFSFYEDPYAQQSEVFLVKELRNGKLIDIEE